MMDYYRHKTILITGAASGIGKRFAERVSEAGDVTLILWDRNPEPLHQLQKNLGGKAAVHIAEVDVTNSGSIEWESGQLKNQKLLPHLIVNCAGIATGKLFRKHSFKEIDQTLQINVAGSMYVVRAFLNEMINRGSGHIVNLASASGYLGNPGMSVYAASKWAILGWTESLFLEMKKDQTGVDVTVVIPSFIDTGMFEGVKPPLLTPILKTDDMVNRMMKGISKRKRTIKAPFMVRFTPVLKGILPATMFDWIAGNVFGVYETMDSFKGKEGV